MADAMRAIMNAGEGGDGNDEDGTTDLGQQAGAYLQATPSSSLIQSQPAAPVKWNLRTVAPAYRYKSTAAGQYSFGYGADTAPLQQRHGAAEEERAASEEQKYDPGVVYGQVPAAEIRSTFSSGAPANWISQRYETPSRRPLRTPQAMATQHPPTPQSTEHQRGPACETNQDTAPDPPTPETPENMFKMKGAHKPEMWDFVRLVRKDAHAGVPRQQLTSSHAGGAYCLKCGEDISYIKGTTNYVKSHMNKRHSGHLEAAQKKRAEAAAAKRKSGVALTSGFACSTTSYHDLPEPEAISPEQQAHVNKLLAVWIAQSLRPFSMIEDSGLATFVQYVCEVLGGVIVKLPSRTLLRATVVDVASQLRVAVKIIITRECTYYSVTTDIWTSRNTDSYMALTIHYVTEDFRFRSWTLEVEQFPGRHSGEAIAAGISRFFERWGLDPSFCAKLLRDGASNATLAGEILEADHMSCIAHSLHLVLSGALIKRKSRKQRRTRGESQHSDIRLGDLHSETATTTDQHSDTRFGDLYSAASPATATSSTAYPTSRAPGTDMDPSLYNPVDEEPRSNYAWYADGSTADGGVPTGAFLLDATEMGEDDVFEADVVHQEQAWDELSDFLVTWLELEKRAALDELRVIVQKFRDIAVYIRKSPKAKKVLETIQTDDLNLKSLKVMIDCPTRWNSARNMLARMVELRKPLLLFLEHLNSEQGKKDFNNVKLTSPAPKDWFAIECLVTLLDPFVAVTEELSGGYPTLVIALPFLRVIKQWLSQTNLFDQHCVMEGPQPYVNEVKFLMDRVRQALLHLFKKRFEKLESELLWITLLDPRLTDMKAFSPAEKVVAKTQLIDAATEVALSRSPPPPAAEVYVPSTPVVQKKKRMQSDIRAMVYRNRASQGARMLPAVDPAVYEQRVRLQCQAEVDNYLALSTLFDGGGDNPLVWWSAKASSFPSLSVLARKWLSCVATSVPSERAFSTAGNVVVAKRSSLDPKVVRDLIFIHENYAEESDN